MNLQVIWFGVILIFLVIAAIIIHEVTHWIVLRRMTGKEIKMHLVMTGKFPTRSLRIKVGDPQDYKGLSDEGYMFVLGSGIATGFLFLLVANDYINGWIVFAASVWYLLSCDRDFWNIFKTINPDNAAALENWRELK